jgi:hypothetical protein
MSRSPEELAEEWSRTPRPNQDVDECELRWSLVCDWEKESFLAGYHLRDEEIEQLEIQIANLKAEIKEEWREEVANLKEEIAMLKAELREVGNE